MRHEVKIDIDEMTYLHLCLKYYISEISTDGSVVNPVNKIEFDKLTNLATKLYGTIQDWEIVNKARKLNDAGQ